jgi:cell division septation protein DedD
MTTEPPRPDQIQANVAAALSRLRGELAPTAPVPPATLAAAPEGGAAGAAPAAPAAAETIPSESHFAASPSLAAPDPSMALKSSREAGEGADTPFAKLTGMAPSEQPDLLAGIGAPPLADLPDAEAEAARRSRRLRNRLIAGGVLLLALAGFWVWSGGGDSGNEPIPVITAETTPEKVKPTDEGGLEVPNQDVAILNGENAAAPAEGETVLPAPEQPATPPAPPEPAAEAAPADAVPSVAAPAVDAIPSVPAPSVPATSDTASAEPAASEAAPAPAEPVTAAETQTTSADAASAQPAAPAVEPAAAGSARIQLAAVKSEADAKKEWARIQKAHPDLLGGLSLHVQRFEKSAGEVYFRIQAGPVADKAAAKQLCSKLKQQNQACIVAN